MPAPTISNPQDRETRRVELQRLLARLLQSERPSSRSARVGSQGVYLAACHPEYTDERIGFVGTQMIQQALRRSERRAGPSSLQEGAEAIARGIDQHFETEARVATTLIARMEAGDVRAVLLAIRIYNLWDDHVDRTQAPSPELAALFQLVEKAQALARHAVETWQQAAAAGDPSRRARARRYLQQIGRALTPDMRGHRGRQAPRDTSQIVMDYWREVFRWQQVRGFISHWPGRPAEKVRAAFEAYHLDELTQEPTRFDRDDLRRFCGITSKEQLISPRPVEEVARTVTARRLSITATRVANILSAWPP